MDIDRAKAVVEVANAITATAKVEVEHMKITGGRGSGFIPLEDANKTPRIAAPNGVAKAAAREPGH